MGLTKTATGISFPWPIIMFLKVLGIHKGLFSKVPYAGVRGRAPRSSLSSLPDKLQFESLSQTYKNDPTEKLPSGRFIFTYSFTLYAHHAPLVKSGKATGIPPLAMDSSERAVTAIQAAPS